MEKIAEKRRIVLVPFPEQGHINTMMLLGQALNLKGFSIIVAQGESNQVISPQHLPDFQFVIIRESVPMSQLQRFGPAEFMKKLNKTSEASFKDSMAQLLLQQGSDIACIIYDDFMYFSEAAAKEFKLPSVSISNVSATHQVCVCILSKVNAEKFLLVDMKDPEVRDKVVENLHPLRYKHLEDLGCGPLEPFLEIIREICSKKVSAMIINTATCLESSSLSWLQQELGIPVFPIGPLHITSSVNSSLLEEDMSCIEWLNKQKPRSVIYISFGSQARMETKEVLEMAWGLYNSNQPFLWVIRPGSIFGSEWLPEEVSKIVSEKGYIVKWAPQIQVLGHPAVGGYWCHSGWNSTLESIGEGVPMICMPFHGEQKLNAMYIESVWKIGIQIEGEVERGVVERAVKRLLVDEESSSMRERALVLKEKVKASVRSGDSSYNALDEFVKFLEKVRN